MSICESFFLTSWRRQPQSKSNQSKEHQLEQQDHGYEYILKDRITPPPQYIFLKGGGASGATPGGPHRRARAGLPSRRGGRSVLLGERHQRSGHGERYSKVQDHGGEGRPGRG